MAKKPYIEAYTDGTFSVDFKQELIPCGTKTITANGTHDVSEFASALVNVEGGGGLDIDYVENIIDISSARTKEYEFSYKELPKALISLVVDDCLPAQIHDCVTKANAKSIPLGMSAISDYFSDVASGTTNTVLEEILVGIENGGEVYLHGDGPITSANITDENFLMDKFLSEKLIFNQNGLYPRGAIVIGGGGELYNRPETDRWVRALFDFSDGWGIGEPYSHRRLAPTDIDTAKAYIDDAVDNHKFIVIFAHKWFGFWNDMIDYAREQGAEFVKWSTVVDSYSNKIFVPPSPSKIEVSEHRTSATTNNKGTVYNLSYSATSTIPDGRSTDFWVLPEGHVYTLHGSISGSLAGYTTDNIKDATTSSYGLTEITTDVIDATEHTIYVVKHNKSTTTQSTAYFMADE